MKLPKFICVGAQKAGTTTLHDILKQHPDIYLPEIKETKFFQLNSRYSQGIEYYKNEFFLNVSENQILGEIDPDYMYFDYVPKRIYETIGANAKLIFMLRNPVTRAYSHYLMSKRRGYEELSFFESIKAEVKRLSIDDSQEEFSISHHHNHSYIDRGYYSKQINEYLKYFKKDNMLFIIFEDDFIKNKERTLNKIYNFIGVANVKVNDQLQSNRSTMYRFKFITNFLNKPKPVLIKKILSFVPQNLKNLVVKRLGSYNQIELKNKSLSKAEKKEVYNEFYKNEIKMLEKLLKRDLSSWYE